MPRLQFYKGGPDGKIKSEDYNFMDSIIREQFKIAGTLVLVHKYLGPHEQGVDADTTIVSGRIGPLDKDPELQRGKGHNDTVMPNYAAEKETGQTNETTIQDLLFLENRDRKYDDSVYHMKGVYNVQDIDFDLTQFGLFIANDTIFIQFHLNETLEILSRKLMNGDVLEFPHMRDDALLTEDPLQEAINRFYVVDDVTRASEGFSQTWFPHILRAKCISLTDAPEYRDIMENISDTTNKALKEVLSTYSTQLGIHEAILESADTDVPRRNYETAHYYIVPGSERTNNYPWIFAGDGEPPNGAKITHYDTKFPPIDDFKIGDYFLHLGYEPAVLYQRQARKWKRMEIDYSRRFVAAHRLLESFINNDETETFGSETRSQKQYITDAVHPKINMEEERDERPATTKRGFDPSV